MAEEITRLEDPIDVMNLMHKAFRAVSERVEKLAAQGEDGGDLTEFNEGFQFWIKQLLFHATAEDKYMTGPLTDCQPARDNESEHAELVQHGGGLIGFLGKGDAAGLEENVQAAMASLEERQHQELAEKAQEVEAALKTALGESRVTARTRRHLYRRVMALRILEYDHFENEEAFVCSLIKERRSEKEQLELAKRLLIDDEAEDPRWIIDWVASELTPTERNLLTEVENRFSEVAKPRKRWWQFR
jgi:hypothetical protein